MKEREFVQGDAYISRRDLPAIVCDQCGNEVHTNIRVPSLNGYYFYWCEQCKRIPTASWKDYKENQVDHFAKQDETNFSKALLGRSSKRYLWLIIDNYRKQMIRYKYSSEKLDLIMPQKSPILQSVSWELEPSLILDFNLLVKKFLSIFSDLEKKELAFLIEELKLDKYLAPGVRENLFKGFEEINLTSYTKQKKSEALGFESQDHNLKDYKKLLRSMRKKTKKLVPDIRYILQKGKSLKSKSLREKTKAINLAADTGL